MRGRGAYDGDTVSDEYAGHFWVMTKVRRNVWTCDTAGGPGASSQSSPGQGTGWWDGSRDPVTRIANTPCHTSPPKYALQMSARPIMVAVSRCNAAGQDCENPKNGWMTYTLAQEYADWGQIAVTRGLVMVNYRDNSTYLGFSALGMIWGFSANALITGAGLPTAASRFLPTPGFQTAADDFTTQNGLTSPLMLAKLHSPSSADFPIVVTEDGGNVASFNLVPTDSAYIQAASQSPQSPTLWDLSPWISSITVSGEAIAPLPAGLTQQFNAHPVWSARSTSASGPGALFWSYINGTQGITAFRWPMTPAPLAVLQPAGSTLGTGSLYQRWDVPVPGGAAAYDFPVFEHNAMTGDNVLLFNSVTGSMTAPNETSHYAVAGPTDTSFQPAVTIAAGLGTSTQAASAGGVVDILSNVSDPIRAQDFMTSVRSNAAGGYDQWMTSVQLNDPPFVYQPSQLSIPRGTTSSITVPFPEWATAPTNVSPPPPTCTAGGDLGAPTQVSVSPQGVTMQFLMPATAPLGTQLIEGISCTNGVSAAIPAYAQPYPFRADPSSITIPPNSGCTSVPLVWDTSGATSNCANAAYAVSASPTIPGLTYEVVASGITVDGDFAWDTLEVCAPTSGSNEPTTLTIVATGCGTGTYTTSLAVEIACPTPTCAPGVCTGPTVADACGDILDCSGNCTGNTTCVDNQLCCPPGLTIVTGKPGCSCPGQGNWNGYNCVTCPSGTVWNTTELECVAVGGIGTGSGGGCRGTTCM